MLADFEVVLNKGRRVVVAQRKYGAAGIVHARAGGLKVAETERAAILGGALAEQKIGERLEAHRSTIARIALVEPVNVLALEVKAHGVSSVRPGDLIAPAVVVLRRPGAVHGRSAEVEAG